MPTLSYHCAQAPAFLGGTLVADEGSTRASQAQQPHLKPPTQY